jgi:hypothetical protein
MKPINKPLYFGLYLIAKVFSLFFLIGPLTWSMGDFQEGDFTFLLISRIFDILAFVVLAVLVYKMWIAIPANQSRTTPAKAVGFLFIPIFNLYWWFQALWGWSQDWNNYASKSKSSLNRVSEVLPLTIAILLFIMGSVGLLLSILGQLWIAAVFSIAICILVSVFIFKVCDVINNVPVAQKDHTNGLTSMIMGILSIMMPYLVLISFIIAKIGLNNMILGILSIIMTFIGLVCGIIAIIYAARQRRIMSEELSKTGLVTGIISTASCGLSVIVFVIGMMFAWNLYEF